MEFNSYEYSCEQKAEGRFIAYKLGLILLYVAYTAIYLYLIIKFAFVPLGALIPVTLWIMIYFTWRYTSPDYKYSIESGMLSFTVSYGKHKKEVFRTHIADARMIATKSEILNAGQKMKIAKAYSALPRSSETDAYGIIFEKESKVYIFLFKATRDAIKILHYYNKSTVVQDKIQ